MAFQDMHDLRIRLSLFYHLSILLAMFQALPFSLWKCLFCLRVITNTISFASCSNFLLLHLTNSDLSLRSQLKCHFTREAFLHYSNLNYIYDYMFSCNCVIFLHQTQLNNYLDNSLMSIFSASLYVS